MKQCISKDQLSELSEKGRENLYLYIKENDLAPHFSGTQMLLFSHEDQVCFAMNIGGMIEFLGDGWEQSLLQPVEGYWENGAKLKVSNDLLCDELWKLVKEKLESS